MLRDRFVFGLLDDSLKERLLRENDLSLTKAIEIAQRQESSKQQIKEMVTKSSVHALSSRKQRSKDSDVLIKCGNCGKHHKPKQCPAYGHKCDICRKLQECVGTSNFRSKHKQFAININTKVDAVEQSESGSDCSSESSDESFTTLYIEPLRIEGLEKQSAWLSAVNTECGKVTFKLDTGAEASVIPTQVFNQLLNTPQLKSTKMKLTAYGGGTIRPVGICNLKCTTKHTITMSNFTLSALILSQS